MGIKKEERDKMKNRKEKGGREREEIVGVVVVVVVVVVAVFVEEEEEGKKVHQPTTAPNFELQRLIIIRNQASMCNSVAACHLLPLSERKNASKVRQNKLHEKVIIL